MLADGEGINDRPFEEALAYCDYMVVSNGDGYEKDCVRCPGFAVWVTDRDRCCAFAGYATAHVCSLSAMSHTALKKRSSRNVPSSCGGSKRHECILFPPLCFAHTDTADDAVLCNPFSVGVGNIMYGTRLPFHGRHSSLPSI